MVGLLFVEEVEDAAIISRSNLASPTMVRLLTSIAVAQKFFWGSGGGGGGGGGGGENHFLHQTCWHGRPVPPLPPYKSFLVEEAAREASEEASKRQDTASTLNNDNTDNMTSSFPLEIDGEAALCDLFELSALGSAVLASPEAAWRAQRATYVPVLPVPAGLRPRCAQRRLSALLPWWRPLVSKEGRTKVDAGYRTEGAQCRERRPP